MNKLDEIFKTNPALLEEPEVKELVKYCEETYNKLAYQADRLNKFKDFVWDRCMYSEVSLKDGDKCKKTVESICEYIRIIESSEIWRKEWNDKKLKTKQ